MGTNFYWLLPPTGHKPLALPNGESITLSPDRDDPRIHIGKRSALREGLTFTWAQEPGPALRGLVANRHTGCVEDEYGRRFTGEQFLRGVLRQIQVHNRRAIGEHFS